MSELVQAGRANFLYYNNRANVPPFSGPGTFFSPTWVVVDRVGDVNRVIVKVTSEINTRESDTAVSVYSARQREVTFRYYKKQNATDRVFDVLQYSYESSQELDIVMSEAPISISGTLYDRGPFIVTEFTKAEPIGGVDIFDVKLKVVLYDFSYMPFYIVDGATVWDDAMVWADSETWTD